MKQEEIWKDIEDYEGLYQVSNLGRIKSFCGWNGKKYVQREKILNPYKQVAGKNYYRYVVKLNKYGKLKDMKVHRLVATTFLENLIDTKMTVNHKDGNRLNNCVENLEWCTRKENIQHAFRTGLQINNQIKIKIEDKITGTIIYPSSLNEGNRLIGKDHSYLSAKIKNKKFENERYKWELL